MPNYKYDLYLNSSINNLNNYQLLSIVYDKIINNIKQSKTLVIERKFVESYELLENAKHLINSLNMSLADQTGENISLALSIFYRDIYYDLIDLQLSKQSKDYDQLIRKLTQMSEKWKT